MHRRIGWVWVVAMTFVATSSFAIRELRHGQLSLLHLLSVVTLASLVLGVVQVRRIPTFAVAAVVAISAGLIAIAHATYRPKAGAVVSRRSQARAPFETVAARPLRDPLRTPPQPPRT